MTRVLPADVYDALELSALAFGGIGAGRTREDLRAADSAPWCVIGHAIAAEGELDKWYGEVRQTVDRVVGNTNETASINDAAVQKINARLGKPHDSRVTFEQWTKELNVVRGR